MARHPHLALLEAIEGIYGPHHVRGVLVDTLPYALECGLRTVQGQHAEYLGSPLVTHRAVKVLCGHLVEWADEDGLRDGRCGAPIVPGGNGCPAHDVPDMGDCIHGMSAALCAGPSHYPMDH